MHFETKPHASRLEVVVGCLEHPEMPATELVLNNFYVAMYASIDDETGEETWETDVVWFHQDNVPGQTKKAKLCRFAKKTKCLTFSQMVGVKFFGPVLIGNMQ
jgi:hypothetical protein